jgi:hypothetical protein
VGRHNLIGIGGSGGLVNGVDGNIVLTKLNGLDLAPLGDNGGPTQTIALLPGSKAIGAGVVADYPGTTTPITTDQRGRPLDTPEPDIGAFQTHRSAPIALAFSGISNPSITYGASSVTVSGRLKNGSQAPVGETVAVTLDGVQQSAKVGSGGAFSTTFRFDRSVPVVSHSGYTITYSYTGDGTFASARTISTLTITPDATATKVTVALKSSAFGQTVTFTATVTNLSVPGMTPTGSVQFVIDGRNRGLPVALLNGAATLKAGAALSSRPHTITAQYIPADGNFAGSSGELKRVRPHRDRLIELQRLKPEDTSVSAMRREGG